MGEILIMILIVCIAFLLGFEYTKHRKNWKKNLKSKKFQMVNKIQFGDIIHGLIYTGYNDGLVDWVKYTEVIGIYIDEENIYYLGEKETDINNVRDIENNGYINVEEIQIENIEFKIKKVSNLNYKKFKKSEYMGFGLTEDAIRYVIDIYRGCNIQEIINYFKQL